MYIFSCNFLSRVVVHLRGLRWSMLDEYASGASCLYCLESCGALEMHMTAVV